MFQMISKDIETYQNDFLVWKSFDTPIWPERSKGSSAEGFTCFRWCVSGHLSSHFLVRIRVHLCEIADSRSERFCNPIFRRGHQEKKLTKVFSLSALKDTKRSLLTLFHHWKAAATSSSQCHWLHWVNWKKQGRPMPLVICQAIDIANKLMFVAFNPCSQSPQWMQREILEMNSKYKGNTMKYSYGHHGHHRLLRERRTCFAFASPWSTPDERQAVREMPQASRHQWRNVEIRSKSSKHLVCLIPLWCRSGPGSHVNT